MEKAPISCGKCGSRIPVGNDGPCPVCEDSPFGKPTYAKAPQISESERLLKDLLALIHHDGGHHTEKVGLKKSVEDAVEVVLFDRARAGEFL